MLYRKKRELERENAFNQAIERALEDKNAGRTKPHTEVRKKYKQWL